MAGKTGINLKILANKTILLDSRTKKQHLEIKLSQVHNNLLEKKCGDSPSNMAAN